MNFVYNIFYVRSDDLITPKRGKVQVMGFEPTRYFYQRILSPLRLPIPPYLHNIMPNR